jgi:hypothetical protein
MGRVEQTGEGRKLRFRNRGVPEARCPESDLDIVRKLPLQSVNIDRGVEEQIWKGRPEVGQKSQLRAITAGEPLVTFLRLEPAQRLLERGARTQD